MQVRRAIELEAGWQDLARMEIEIPGDRASILADANAVFLAGELNKCIQSTLIESIHQATLNHQQIEPICKKVL